MSAPTLTTHPYKHTLVRPIVTAHGTYAERRGVILRLETEDGIIGLGDVAPLPGFSKESYEQVADVLKSLAISFDIPGDPTTLAELSAIVAELARGCASVRFGLECALVDAAARRAGLPLARWLSPDAALSVPINRLLTATDADEIALQAGAAWSDGFRTFKLKVAVGDPDRDIARIRAVRRVTPEAEIRIDANSGWDESKARYVLNGIRDCAVAFVEQPLPVGNVLPSRRLADDCSVPLALDEEIETAADAVALIEEELCHIVVIKPMIVGGLTDTLRVIDCARRHNVAVVLTSSWESDIGLAATLHCAAVIGDGNCAAGLSTAGMIATGIVTNPLRIQRGQLALSDDPGLGMTLVEDFVQS